VLRVHCGIYKSSYSISNTSHLTPLPPSYELLFLALRISCESALPTIAWGLQAFMLITYTFLGRCSPRYLGYASSLSAPGQVK
jgi:hypothetical protein